MTPSETPLWWRFAVLSLVVALGGCAYGLARSEQLPSQGVALAGVVCFIGVAVACSANMRAINAKTVLAGLLLQVGLAFFVLRFEIGDYRPGYELFRGLGQLAARFLDFSNEGAKFVFGSLADQAHMEEVHGKPHAFVFAFRALPTIIFVSSFFTVLYYFGVLQLLVRGMAAIMMRIMGTSGAETLSSAANVFMGQTEAPLIVKPYVPSMTRSELLAMMVGGMATISGSLMAVYIGMVGPEFAPAILATSVMAAPCGLYLAKILMPETEVPKTSGGARGSDEKPPFANAVDAAAAGASDGLHLALNVAAMLIAFLAMIALVNAVLALGHPSWSLGGIFSYLFAPAAFLMGVPLADVPSVAQLLGTKLIANEFVAFIQLTDPSQFGGKLDPRSVALATYALTGFANVSSVGIQLGGIGALAPERRGELAALSGRALLGGFLATLINASVAGILMR